MLGQLPAGYAASHQDAMEADEVKLEVAARRKSLWLRHNYTSGRDGQTWRYFVMDLYGELAGEGFDLWREAMEYIKSVKRQPAR